MRVIEGRNVHAVLPMALRELRLTGVRRDSRGGPVIQAPTPVTTVYRKPYERVILWPQRDANPFLHLYESLWMLQGRNDVAPLMRYASRFLNYSNDGSTLHAAYGHRWRMAFEKDQLDVIVERLRNNLTDRRSVLQMWHSDLDLHVDDDLKDVPCNTMATFQIFDDKLHMVVFCRSNDIVWGAYGANAVHFAFLQEYLATRIEVAIGTYTQVSVNWHGYANVVEPLFSLANVCYSDAYVAGDTNPYDAAMTWIPMTESADRDARLLLTEVDSRFPSLLVDYESNFFHMAHKVLHAHQTYEILKGKGDRPFLAALDALEGGYQTTDWVVAARQWLQRRYWKWQEKNGGIK